MKQSEFKYIFRPEFEGFTIRMWLDFVMNTETHSQKQKITQDT